MNILILGRSEKFLDIFKIAYPDSFILVVPWRELRDDLLLSTTFDIVAICGYDYSSYLSCFQKYLKVNVYNPVAFIKSVNGPFKMIYIDTVDTKRNFTFSRYVYAKKLLAYMLFRELKNHDFFILKPHCIVINDGFSIRGDFVSKILFNILKLFNKISFTNINDITLWIKNCAGRIDSDPICPKPLLLNFRRTQFSDRFLRFIYG